MSNIKQNKIMKKDYIKPFVKVKVLDTDLCQIPIVGSVFVDPSEANSKEIFDYIFEE